MSCCDGYLLVEAEIDERGVNALHCGEEVGGEGGVVEGEDLVADEDGGDFSGWEVRLDVGFHPCLCLLWVLHLGEKLVAEAYHELHSGAGERRENARIGVVELDLGGADAFHQRNYLLR